MPSQHVEVERKFDVVDSTLSPSFDGLSAVARVERSPSQHLEAVYFDTPSHDLAAHRITLRRRTGGADAGWHLKLPAGPDTRTEVRVPLDDGVSGVVPDALRDIVLAIVRDRPLAPVARISTDRTVDALYDVAGARVAEFSDDTVTASAGEGDRQQWREWELELAEGASASRELLDRLANRLLDAGAEPAGHGSKLARVLSDAAVDVPAPKKTKTDPIHRAVAEQVDQLVEWDRAVRADVYDSVHQMRVTTRKIRSLLQGSEVAFGITSDAWILDELRQLASVLGVARDAEVLAERYERALDELPDDLVRGPVRKRLVDGAKRRYKSGWRRSLIAMRSDRYFRLLGALDGLVAETERSARQMRGESRLPTDQLGVLAAGEARYRVALAAYKIATLAHGVVSMSRVDVGVISVHPRAELSRGMRDALARRVGDLLFADADVEQWSALPRDALAATLEVKALKLRSLRRAWRLVQDLVFDADDAGRDEDAAWDACVARA